MGMSKPVLRFVSLLGSHLTNHLADESVPATIPPDSEERPVRWVPDGANSWRIIYAD